MQLINFSWGLIFYLFWVVILFYMNNVKWYFSLCSFIKLAWDEIHASFQISLLDYLENYDSYWGR